MKNIELAFKKLLGKGRAFLTPVGFMSDFLDLLVSPFVILKERILNLRFSHFPTTNLDENDIVNGEELFALTDTENLTLEQRAVNVESQWRMFAGLQTYKQIETILRNMGFNVTVIENIPNQFKNIEGLKAYGNSFLKTDSGNDEPAKLKNGNNTFVVEMNELDDSVILRLIDETVKIKPAHNLFLLLYKFIAEYCKVHVGVALQESFTSNYDCRGKL